MSVERYRFSLLQLKDFKQHYTPQKILQFLRWWRKSHLFQNKCTTCKQSLVFVGGYTTCCEQFYYNGAITSYPVHSMAVSTPGYPFLIQQLARMIRHEGISSNQEFLVLPDPVYWQIQSTLVFEKALKFSSGIPVTRRTETVQPASKAPVFYKQIQEAPLNYGSLNARSCGKSTLLRQVAFGKRCRLSMRGMIVPDATLKPNEIRIPHTILQTFHLEGQWVLLNRMPSLQPENIVALRVPRGAPPWQHDCFGIPLEIIEAINGDFDGDECNIYLVPNYQCQAECATLLNPESEMGSFVTRLKLSPSQDMLVAYHLYYDEIDFLPFKMRDLKRTFQVIYELYGSRVAFEAIDHMRQFYLDVLQNRLVFALTLEEMERLRTLSLKEMQEQQEGCLITQVRSGAKGSFEHLYQMFRQVGWQNGTFIHHSFWDGLTACEAVAHAVMAVEGLSNMGKIWEPGYGYSKSIYNLQGLHVDYLGRLVDGNLVVERDVLDALHHTDVLSHDTFDYFVQQVLIGGDSQTLSTK